MPCIAIQDRLFACHGISECLEIFQDALLALHYKLACQRCTTDTKP